jgi:hypothetical protein
MKKKRAKKKPSYSELEKMISKLTMSSRYGKLGKKPVRRKAVAKPKVTTAKKNPRGRDYVIEGKFFNKTIPFFWNGNGFVNLKSNASRYSNIDNAASVQRSIKKRAISFPNLNFVRVVRA